MMHRLLRASPPSVRRISFTGVRFFARYSPITRSPSSPRRSPSNVEPSPNEKRHAPSGHLVFYRELVPAMIPIFLLGSAVFVSLQLAQTYLAHEKYALHARQYIKDLEEELEKLSLKASSGLEGSDSLPSAKQSGKRWWGVGLF